MATDLTADCRDGYNAPDAANPFFFSSPCWLAFAAGQQVAGMSGIKRACMSRGYNVRITTDCGNTVLVRFAGKKLGRVTIRYE